MAVDKFSISLPEELVSDVDAIAREDGLTRSAVIREATTGYVAARKSAGYEAVRQRRIAAAIDGFDAVAADWGADSKSGVDYLADIRGEASRPENTDDQVAPKGRA